MDDVEVVKGATVLDLTFPALPGRPLEVLCIGAHCDDIEIGCGGTVRLLQKRPPIAASTGSC